MDRKVWILFFSITLVLFSCVSKNKNDKNSTPGVHEVTVNEVVQASAYTYLNVNEDGEDFWIAVSKTDAAKGETYYYDKAMEMTNFKSKDLDRTFETIFFIQNLSKTPVTAMPHGHGHEHEGHHGMANMTVDESHAGKPNIAKTAIKVDPAEGGLTIAEIYAQKADQNNKEVIVKGKVVKVNPAIMNKNWIHIQDGSDHNGDFDLTVTTLEEGIKEGDIVTFKGLLAVDKDFGYGYKYDVILEDAMLMK